MVADGTPGSNYKTDSMLQFHGIKEGRGARVDISREHRGNYRTGRLASRTLEAKGPTHDGMERATQ